MREGGLSGYPDKDATRSRALLQDGVDLALDSRGLDLLPLHAGRERADLLVGFGQPLEKRRQLMDAGAEFCTAERGTVMAFPRYASEPGRCLPVRRTGSRRPGRLDTVSIGP